MDEFKTLQERYARAAHAMQAGVDLKMHRDGKETSPKHLRVGVNSSMSDHGGLAGLLIKKGLITHQEYLEAITEAMEREAQSYESELQGSLGANIKLH